MKSKLKNKKVLAAIIGVALLLVSVIGVMTVNKQIVFAKDGTVLSILNPIEALAETEGEFEVKVKYVFDDEKVFKEEVVKADKGQILDSGDLPMLPDDMKFIDDFLYYEVKGDGHDEIIRKVEKIVKDKETQTENEKDKEKKSEELKQDKATQTEEPKKDSSTQTDVTKSDLDKMDKESKELKDKIDSLSKALKDKDKLSDKQKDKIKNLEDEIEALEKKIKKDKENIDSSKENAELKKSIEELEKKTKELQDKLNSINKIGTNPNSTISNPVPKNSGSFSSFIPSTPVNTGKGSNVSGNVSTTTPKTESKVETKSDKKEEKQEIRYPNKLTPKQTSSNGETSSMDGSSKPVNTNKGVASAPSKARGSVTENKDNANKDYPIHHNDGKDDKSKDMYSADARQFVTFTTKNGKTFHLIINYDEDSENVMLLTEVSEDDLLNMVEKKEPQKEIVKEEPMKEESKPVKKEESSNMGTYLILILVVAGALGAGYYFKVVKKKENEELEALEDDDDDFFSEADESDETSEVEVEEIETDEEE
ncbi:CD1107 family mobile element protein [Thomasclavelia ramosa]|uniref:CD1107 family mobile element protein n=1 Tax=Thomasclavelia ramosa TaxID=1547 RepID=UPI003DA3AC99